VLHIPQMLFSKVSSLLLLQFIFEYSVGILRESYF